MPSFDETISAAVHDGLLPGVILHAKDKFGQLNYSNIITPENAPPHLPPITPSSTLWLASATKLITTISLLQLVERGYVTLDEDITHHLPVLASQQLLITFPPSGTPLLTPRKNPVTLRQLLTHSAGLAYDFLSPGMLQRWQAHHDIVPATGATVEDRFAYPFLYEPGTDWAYSNAIDWAGRVLEAVTGTDLGSHMRENIFAPLGLTSFAFSPPTAAESLWPLSARDPATGKIVPFAGHHLQDGVTGQLGGQGLYGRMDEYLQILHSILTDDGRLLRPETSATMFEPQLGAASKLGLLRDMEDPSWAPGHFPGTGEYDWGLGGVLIDGDSHPHRRRGTLIWSGAANIFWWIDREAGLCGVFGTQIMPAGEAVTRVFTKAFEDEMYVRLRALQSVRT